MDTVKESTANQLKTDSGIPEDEFWNFVEKKEKEIDEKGKELLKRPGPVTVEEEDELNQIVEKIGSFTNQVRLSFQTTKEVFDHIFHAIKDYEWTGAESFGIVDAYDKLDEFKEKMKHVKSNEDVSFEVPASTMRALMEIIQNYSAKGYKQAVNHKHAMISVFYNNDKIKKMQDEHSRIAGRVASYSQKLDPDKEAKDQETGAVPMGATAKEEDQAGTNTESENSETEETENKE